MTGITDSHNTVLLDRRERPSRIAAAPHLPSGWVGRRRHTADAAPRPGHARATKELHALRNSSSPVPSAKERLKQLQAKAAASEDRLQPRKSSGGSTSPARKKARALKSGTPIQPMSLAVEEAERGSSGREGREMHRRQFIQAIQRRRMLLKAERACRCLEPGDEAHAKRRQSAPPLEAARRVDEVRQAELRKIQNAMRRRQARTRFRELCVKREMAIDDIRQKLVKHGLVTRDLYDSGQLTPKTIANMVPTPGGVDVRLHALSKELTKMDLAAACQ